MCIEFIFIFCYSIMFIATIPIFACYLKEERPDKIGDSWLAAYVFGSLIAVGWPVGLLFLYLSECQQDDSQDIDDGQLLVEDKKTGLTDDEEIDVSKCMTVEDLIQHLSTLLENKTISNSTLVVSTYDGFYGEYAPIKKDNMSFVVDIDDEIKSIEDDINDQLIASNSHFRRQSEQKIALYKKLGHKVVCIALQ